jgi:hypothetical protein
MDAANDRAEAANDRAAAAIELADHDADHKVGVPERHADGAETDRPE